ncbi:hypothetical protein A2641_03325 [Candidatus Nomurabacteria bacterium RIFCSPHIGHO2_01_FULL_37_25]|uniref:PsbP C-terminal domain-containing protein n=1 Tax=Candidatus Nomurabacteria bacterium RIFCSPLOWO2_01_FULL_36_16 TaxID=1801767 RepID=A0A1F6WZR0_9BACT|nr:MAG: hypothetical protein A2641_03325 [Candidatus Nomurabacteria bacterium RIFCSPHIGHO2_01_FULL_37_25]OGI75520.1 MAG: hypothetical protein A3D36_02970 [Candidatus Nomurabacteria bacterium RIFCSPHIGHO2_02_FULL_36_29]OGI87358.1 MAG: hypothetical protein A3A91_02590 [Candidatus Nomurabacteria bacterium RIFCSPLOWO2_01_FULL_36_16]OGI94906.1 MAG: hypothetical protein A3I84_00655 [Candidatus Nomurabacteria bacterium RIFCSPLOWO2_02_FULL_36_8]
MQKGFGFIGILVVVGIVAILGVGVLKMGFFLNGGKGTQVPIGDNVQVSDDVVEKKSGETLLLIDPIKDETVNWKTYRNEKYGFEFKYPDDWLEDNDNYGVRSTIVTLRPSSEPTYKFHIGLSVYPDQTNLQEFLKNKYDASLNWKESIFSGLPAKEIVVTDRFQNISISTIFVKDNTGYSFGTFPSKDGEERINVARQIAKTFKFTK